MTNENPKPPHNPYAAPRAAIEAPADAIDERAPGEIVKWLLAGVTGIAATVWLGSLTLVSWLDVPRSVTWGLFVVHQALAFARAVLAMSWLFYAWKGVPEIQRGTISPSRAAFSLLIPFYNVYWIFMINVALCDTLNGILERSREPVRAPRVLAQVATYGNVMSAVLLWALMLKGHAHEWLRFLAMVLTSGVWLVYAFECDKARRAVWRLRDSPATIGAPRLSPFQRSRGLGIFGTVSIYIGLIFALAVWQFLSPSDRSRPRVTRSAISE